ncbi:hypothetical protein KY284_010906 [Solanum tuberosum]|nr:hypothetical protein KY284_010906 [Solanum tuberosum]
MKDEIGAHKKLPVEVIDDTWWRFTQKMKRFLNHGLTERSLNFVVSPVVDAVCGGSFMRKMFLEIMVIMDEVSKNNGAWHTGHADAEDVVFTFELSADQRKREEGRDEDMAHMKTQMDLITKHLTVSQEKVTAVGAANRYEEQDVNFYEEANYLNNKRISEIITRETKVIIFEIKVGTIS